jgi:23S rRNA G2445 N2-methylase RlmL
VAAGHAQRLALPLYDPCCGSGTIVIEAAQLALGLPAGSAPLPSSASSLRCSAVERY